MAYPVLMASNSWYKGSIDKATITRINILDSYIATGEEDESWNADTEDSGAIKCYAIGTEVIIAGNGSGKIMANSDSSWLFGNLGALIEVNGCELLDFSNTTTLERAFQADFALESVNVSKMVGSTVTNIKGMFQGCKLIGGLDVSKWDTSNVTTMQAFLNMPGSDYFNSNLTELDVSKWDTSNCETMYSLFQGLLGITVFDFSNWDTSKVTKMDYMLNNCQNLQKVYVSSKWDTSNVTTSSKMFAGCISLIGGAGTKYNSEKVDITYAITDNGYDKSGYLTYLGEISFVKPHDIWMLADAIRTLKGESVNYSLPEMIAVLRDYPILAPQQTWYKSEYNIAQITSVNVTNNYSTTGNEDESWNADAANTGSIICYRLGSEIIITPTNKNKIRLNPDSSNLFAEMSALENITGLEYMDASGVESLEKAFYKDSSLISVDLSNWRLVKLQNSDEIFSYCSKIVSLNLGSGLRTLGAKALYICLDLEEIKGLSRVADLGYYSIYFTPKIQSSDLIPERIKKIGNSACRLSGIEDNNDLSSIPLVKIGENATRRARWSTDALTDLKNINFSESIYIDVPNPDSQLNYPEVMFYTDANGEQHSISDRGCSAVTMYHIWNSLYAGTDKQFNNFLEWWNNTLNINGDFADNFNYDLSNRKQVMCEKLGWTFLGNQRIGGKEQLETVLNRLSEGYPTLITRLSREDGIIHANAIIGYNKDTKKLAVIDPGAHSMSTGVIYWAAFEDIFTQDTTDQDRITLIDYNIN